MSFYKHQCTRIGQTVTYFVVSGGAALIVPARKYSRFTVKGHAPATLERKTRDKQNLTLTRENGLNSNKMCQAFVKLN